MTVPTTIEFLQHALGAMQLKSGASGPLDLFADRLVKASSEPTLYAATERLLRDIDASTDSIHPPLAARMYAVAVGPDGPRVLRWWREQAKLVTLLAATRDPKAREEALAGVVLPDGTHGGQAVPRGAFDVGIRATCESPLAHGADGKAGNATIFRRMQVLGSEGVLFLPYYAGNALRGQMRDLLADHLLASLGLPVDRSRPVVEMWFFYALYSGGALEESSLAKRAVNEVKAAAADLASGNLTRSAKYAGRATVDALKAIRGLLGDHGATRGAGIRGFRDELPALSLLGCALGSRILPGHCQFADLRPVCFEWGTGARPAAELLTWEYLTRREDHEDHVEHHGMIANSEVLRAGAELEGGVDMDSAMPSVERAALGRGLLLLAERGMLGAENRRGFGRVKLELADVPDPAEYDDFLASQKPRILAYLRDVGALLEPALAV